MSLPIRSRTVTQFALIALLSALTTACSGSDSAPVDAGGDAGGDALVTTDASSETSSPDGAGADLGVDLGETDASPPPTTASVPLDGDPNGLYWDAPTSTLFVADDGNNRILTYRDGAGFSKYADLPSAPASGPGLGQLVRLADGSLLVTRFGFGSTGDIVQVKPDRTTAIVPGLDPSRRRIGLAVAPDGTIYDTYFQKTGSGYVGAIASVTLAGKETDVVTGLTKVVGVLATSDTLFFDDQTAGKLFAAPLSAPSTMRVVAALPSADLLCVGPTTPTTTLFSGGADGNVRAIDAAGTVTVFATGFAAARGVAFDAAARRLFIANHVGTAGSNTVEIRPVP
jgi:sugar lactone lactonase YvrE